MPPAVDAADQRRLNRPGGHRRANSQLDTRHAGQAIKLLPQVNGALRRPQHSVLKRSGLAQRPETECGVPREG